MTYIYDRRPDRILILHVVQREGRETVDRERGERHKNVGPVNSHSCSSFRVSLPSSSLPLPFFSPSDCQGPRGKHYTRVTRRPTRDRQSCHSPCVRNRRLSGPSLSRGPTEPVYRSQRNIHFTTSLTPVLCSITYTSGIMCFLYQLTENFNKVKRGIFPLHPDNRSKTLISVTTVPCGSPSTRGTYIPGTGGTSDDMGRDPSIRSFRSDTNPPSISKWVDLGSGPRKGHGTTTGVY